MAQEMEVPYLGGIPIDPRIARSCDEGIAYLEEYPDSPATKAFNQIIDSMFRSALIFSNTITEIVASVQE